MDFSYSPQEEAYRKEVRSWLEANQPPPLTKAEKDAADEEFLWQRLKTWHKRLYKADGPVSVGPRNTAGGARPLSNR